MFWDIIVFTIFTTTDIITSAVAIIHELIFIQIIIFLRNLILLPIINITITTLSSIIAIIIIRLISFGLIRLQKLFFIIHHLPQYGKHRDWNYDFYMLYFSNYKFNY